MNKSPQTDLRPYNTPSSWLNQEGSYLESRNYDIRSIKQYMHDIDAWAPAIWAVQLRVRHSMPKVALELTHIDDNDICHATAEGYVGGNYVQCKVGFQSKFILNFKPYFKVVDKFGIIYDILDRIEKWRLVAYAERMRGIRRSPTHLRALLDRAANARLLAELKAYEARLQDEGEYYDHIIEDMLRIAPRNRYIADLLAGIGVNKHLWETRNG